MRHIIHSLHAFYMNNYIISYFNVKTKIIFFYRMIIRYLLSFIIIYFNIYEIFFMKKLPNNLLYKSRKKIKNINVTLVYLNIYNNIKYIFI